MQTLLHSSSGELDLLIVPDRGVRASAQNPSLPPPVDTSLEGFPSLPSKLAPPISLAQEFQLRDERLTEVA